jgi:hypothetical protein
MMLVVRLQTALKAHDTTIARSFDLKTSPRPEHHLKYYFCWEANRSSIACKVG